MTVCCLF